MSGPHDRRLPGTTAAAAPVARRAVRALALLAPLAAPVAAQHQDAKLGFAFEPPPEWRSVPMAIAGDWIVAKYQAERTDYFESLETYDSHTPVLLVLAFPPGAAAPAAPAGPGSSRPSPPPPGDRPAAAPPFTNPYPNYLAYVEAEITAAPVFEAKRKEAGAAHVYEFTYTLSAKAAPKARPLAARRVVAWVHHLPQADLVAQIEVLDAAYDKREVEIESSLKSVRAFAKAAKPADPKNRSAPTTIDELWKLTPEERKVRRAAAERAAHEQAKAALPEGWSASVDGRFLVLNHADQKLANKFVALGGAILEFLDTHFDYVGKGEHVRRPILRICADSRERQAMRSEGSWWGGTNLEIVTYKDEDEGVASPAFGEFSQAVFKHWWAEHDLDFALAAPEWFSEGMLRTFRAARIKEGQLVFSFDEREYTSARIAFRDKQHVTLKQMMTPPPEGTEPAEPTVDQSACAARFFLAGMGAREPRYREAFRSFVKNYRAAIADARKEGLPGEAAEGARQAEARAAFWRPRRAKLLAAASTRTFAKWKDADWKAMEFAYQQFLAVVK